MASVQKKNNEKNCLCLLRDHVLTSRNNRSRKYFNSLFPIGKVENSWDLNEAESPDFVLKSNDVCYGIEHFMVDFCYGGNKSNQSKSRMVGHEIDNIYSKYHDQQIGTIKECNKEKAINDIENLVKNISTISNEFDYEQYISNFRRTFNKHYGQVQNYKKNSLFLGSKSVKIGFLIEFHCDMCLIGATKGPFVVKIPKTKRRFPLVKDVVQIIREANQLDFVILAQFDEGIDTILKCVDIYDPNNIAKSIEEQRIDVYDSILYIYK